MLRGEGDEGVGVGGVGGEGLFDEKVEAGGEQRLRDGAMMDSGRGDDGGGDAEGADGRGALWEGE